MDALNRCAEGFHCQLREEFNRPEEKLNGLEPDELEGDKLESLAVRVAPKTIPVVHSLHARVIGSRPATAKLRLELVSYQDPWPEEKALRLAGPTIGERVWTLEDALANLSEAVDRLVREVGYVDSEVNWSLVGILVGLKELGERSGAVEIGKGRTSEVQERLDRIEELLRRIESSTGRQVEEEIKHVSMVRQQINSIQALYLVRRSRLIAGGFLGAGIVVAIAVIWIAAGQRSDEIPRAKRVRVDQTDWMLLFSRSNCGKGEGCEELLQRLGVFKKLEIEQGKDVATCLRAMAVGKTLPTPTVVNGRPGARLEYSPEYHASYVREECMSEERISANLGRLEALLDGMYQGGCGYAYRDCLAGVEAGKAAIEKVGE